MFDLYDCTVDDVANTALARTVLVTVHDEEVLETPVVEERNPSCDPVYLADGLDPRADQERDDARPKCHVDVEEEQLFAV